MSSTLSTPIFWVGLDVHKDSVTAAVFQDRDPQPLRVDRLPNDHGKLRRWFQRLQHDGQVRACYEASGAGYVLQRALEEWGVECQLAAPSLIPRRRMRRSAALTFDPSSSRGDGGGASRPGPTDPHRPPGRRWRTGIADRAADGTGDPRYCPWMDSRPRT
jgi:hypothetical protein